MTKLQQALTRELDALEAKWLASYGWRQHGRGWTHPRLEPELIYTLRDAVTQTRAELRLGWP